MPLTLPGYPTTLSAQKTAAPTSLSSAWSQPAPWSPPTSDPYQQPSGPTRQVPQTSGYDSGVLSTPGTGEQWYSSHQGAFDQPTNSQTYWDGVSGQVMGGPNETNWTEQMLGTMPGQTSSVAGLAPLGDPRSFGMNTNFGPSYSEGMNFNLGPTAASSLGLNFGPNNASRLDTSVAPRVSDQLGLQFGPTSASLLSMLLGKGYSEGAFGTSAGELAGPTAAETGYAKGDFTRDSSYSLPQLRDKSYMERLADDPQMGFGQYYDRAHEVAQEKLDNATSARGIWNSGVALDEERELAKDMQAQRAKDETNWIQSTFAGADASKSRRLGQEMDLTSGMASDRREGAKLSLDALLGRVGARTQAASAADNARLGLLGEERSRAGLKDASSMAQAAEQRMRAGQRDEMLMAALGEQRQRVGLQDASNQADRMESRLRAGLQDTSALGFAGEERLRRTAADDARMDLLGEERQRINQMDTLGLQYGQEDRQRAEDLDKYGLDYSRLGLDYGKAMDDNALDWSTQSLNYLLGGNTIANTADANNRALLGLGGDFAYRNQDVFQEREHMPLDDLYKMIGMQSGTLNDTVTSGLDSQRGWTEDQVNALLGIGSGAQKDSQNDRDQTNADIALITKLLGFA